MHREWGWVNRAAYVLIISLLAIHITALPSLPDDSSNKPLYQRYSPLTQPRGYYIQPLNPSSVEVSPNTCIPSEPLNCMPHPARPDPPIDLKAVFFIDTIPGCIVVLYPYQHAYTLSEGETIGEFLVEHIAENYIRVRDHSGKTYTVPL